MRDVGEGADVRHDATRVGQALGPDGLGAGAGGGDGGADGGGVVDVDEGALPAELLDGLAELGDGAAVEAAGGDDGVPRLHEGEEREQLGRVAGGGAGGAAAALEVGEALLEDGGGGVGQARVDVAEGLQVEERRGVVRVVEHCAAARASATPERTRTGGLRVEGSLR